MIRKGIILLCCVLVSVSLGPAGAGPPPDPRAIAAANASNAFAADLYKRLASGTTGNLFVSPGSVHLALAMAFTGAAGNTADEMARTLHLGMPRADVPQAVGALLEKLDDVPSMEIMESPRDLSKTRKVPAYQLSLASAIWGQKGLGFRAGFLRLLQENYHAGLQEVDFRQAETARGRINEWVEQTTEGKIRDLVPEGAITDATRMVLANAVYFRSNWADTFDKEATKGSPFKLSAEETVSVPMMHQEREHAYLETDDFQCVELPYQEHALSMLVFLPRRVDGLAVLERALTAENLATWAGRLTQTKVILSLPKFTIADQFQLARALQAMGMKDAFDVARADFSSMTAQEKLNLGAVIHKTVVSVDEEGTEAAAATAVVMLGSSGPRPEEPKVFNADHPFVFLIRHNATGEILFMGRLVDPKG